MEIEEKKLYFKVYQDKECVNGRYYVDTPENVMNCISHWGETNDSGELFPVLEPVFMTEQEFKNLPEFAGY